MDRMAEYDIVTKLLIKSEEGNVRITKKVHDIVLEISSNPGLYEDFITAYIVARIGHHNKSDRNYIQNSSPSGSPEKTATINPTILTQNVKGLISGIILLQKLLKSHGVSKKGPLSIQSVMSVLPLPLQHQNSEVRNEALKVVLYVHESTNGAIDERYLKDIGNESIKNGIIKKLEAIKPNSTKARRSSSADRINSENAEEVYEKIRSKEWADKENILKQIKEELEFHEITESSLSRYLDVLKISLEESNISVYLIAIEIVPFFLMQLLKFGVDIIIEHSNIILKPVIAKSADTNTRVRKNSTECFVSFWQKITEIYENKNMSIFSKLSHSLVLLLTDESMGEKAILGRLNLIYKRLQQVNVFLPKSGLTEIIGLDCLSLMQFVSRWCSHKNTKIRQLALKLILEICKFNYATKEAGIGERKIILSHIYGLKSSMKEPLLQKLNKTLANFTDIPNFNEKIVEAAEKAAVLLVLPKAESISREQKIIAQPLIEYFGIDFVNCFYSKSWKNRDAALNKAIEQVQILGSGDKSLLEINKCNANILDSFKIFQIFVKESFKDPVLNLYLLTLEMLQKSLLVFFKSINRDEVKQGLEDIIILVLTKTSDLKVKVRDASINMLIYLSNQEPIGQLYLANLTLIELEKMIKIEDKKQDVSSSFGNSVMWSSCINLLTQFAGQNSNNDELRLKEGGELLLRVMMVVNKSLKHQAQAVRSAAETLFGVVHKWAGDKIESMLEDQKSVVLNKIKKNVDAEESHKKYNSKININRPGSVVTESKNTKKNENKIHPALIAQFGESTFDTMFAPNSMKIRLKAITEFKKSFVQIVAKYSPKQKHDLFEPLSTLLRELLNDESSEIYIKTLSLLKIVVTLLAGSLNALELHLIIGSFINTVISKTVSNNMKLQVASDKLILFLAKHDNIGPYLIAREIIKNIEKAVGNIGMMGSGAAISEHYTSKKNVVLRYFTLLNMLIAQFSTLLVYQTEFIDKCIAVIAGILTFAFEDISTKNAIQQVVESIQNVDKKVLDASIAKLDPTKKIYIRKMTIEIENKVKDGKNMTNQPIFMANSVAEPLSPSANNNGSRNVSSRVSDYRSILNSRETTRDIFSVSSNRGFNDTGRITLRGSITDFKNALYGDDDPYKKTTPKNAPTSRRSASQSFKESNENVTKASTGYNFATISNAAENTGIGSFLPDINNKAQPKNALPPLSSKSRTPTTFTSTNRLNFEKNTFGSTMGSTTPLGKFGGTTTDMKLERMFSMENKGPIKGTTLDSLDKELNNLKH